MREKPGKLSKSEVSAARFITRKVNFRKLKRTLLYSPGEQLTEFLGTEKYRHLAKLHPSVGSKDFHIRFWTASCCDSSLPFLFLILSLFSLLAAGENDRLIHWEWRLKGLTVTFTRLHLFLPIINNLFIFRS